RAYELPTWEPPTDGGGSSSSRGLLPTPRAQDRETPYARGDYHANLDEWVGHHLAGSLNSLTRAAETLPDPEWTSVLPRAPETAPRADRGSEARGATWCCPARCSCSRLLPSMTWARRTRRIRGTPGPTGCARSTATATGTASGCTSRRCGCS